MRESDSWSRDVVLKALVDRVCAQRKCGEIFDFILLTGDLAYSGKFGEYALVSKFITSLCEASGVPVDQIYCVPGNHDIDRDRQKLCFAGARTTLQDESRVDELLTGGEDLTTLLLRQEAYRRFISEFFVGQTRQVTPDGLAYVSRICIEDVELAIVGLDSTWVANGGIEDHGKLLIGEHQLIDALQIAQSGANRPHLLVAMSHHPLHLLYEFDRNPVQNRIERECHFFHSGHLHEPEVRTVSQAGPSCMMVAAGAAFATRRSHNVYSVIAVNLAEGTRSIEIMRYDPGQGNFSPSPKCEYTIDLAPARGCTLSELAQAIAAEFPVCRLWVHYLAALLLDVRSDFPLVRPHGIEFASISVIRDEPDSETRAATLRFIQFRNILRVLYGTVPLREMLAKHGAMLRQFGNVLSDLSNTHNSAKTALLEYERGSGALATSEPTQRPNYANEVMQDLAEAQDWIALRQYAERYLDSGNHESSVLAGRMLALSLAHSSELSDRQMATERFSELLSSPYGVVADACHLTALLLNEDRAEEAKAIVSRALKQFIPAPRELIEIGQRVVQATGDRDLRQRLSAPVSKEN
jgi:predicted phosphodiesterase